MAAAGRAEGAEEIDAHRDRALQEALRLEAVANRRAARIGPTVCELEGPIPILKRSKALMGIRLRQGYIGAALPAALTGFCGAW